MKKPGNVVTKRREQRCHELEEPGVQTASHAGYESLIKMVDPFSRK